MGRESFMVFLTAAFCVLICSLFHSFQDSFSLLWFAHPVHIPMTRRLISVNGAVTKGQAPHHKQERSLNTASMNRASQSISQTSLKFVRAHHVKQKGAVEAKVSSFLAELKPPKDIPSGRPSEVVKFLVWKDQAGRTKIHSDQCQRLGHRGLTSCPRPLRLAYRTVDFLIGTIKIFFVQNNRVSDWDPVLGIGNRGSWLVFGLSNFRLELPLPR